MKYLMVAVVLALTFWIWRKNRADAAQVKDQRKPIAPQASSSQPQLMITCGVCGVHLPKADAVTGQLGMYCSAAHLQDKEA
jgi:uncharacterized protein